MRKSFFEKDRVLRHIFVLLMVLTLLPTLSSGGPLTPKEEWGRQIYLKTTSPSGREIKAFVGIAAVEAPGSAMPCANCHGYDGMGRPEGGITPSNITWKELTKSYGVKHSDGREHPAYTEETLGRAVAKGLDPAGKKLNPAMPIYSMPGEDLDALIAYLKKLGTDLDPGLTENHIRIGTILPPEGPLGEMGKVIEEILQANFDDINEKGGIYSRRLELVVERSDGKTSLTKEKVKDFIRDKDLFALVSTFTPGLDKEIPFLVETETIPLVGPFTLFPLTDLSLNRYLFYIFSGLRELGCALVDFAADHLRMSNPFTVILHPARTDLSDTIEAAEKRGRGKAWKRVSRIEYSLNGFDAEGWIKQLKKENVDLLLFLGNESEAVALLKAAKGIDWLPYILLPGVLTGKSIYEIPSGFKDKVFLAYPTLPEDRKERGMREFSSLSRRRNLPAAHLAAQLSAYSAVQILVESLKRSGRNLSREKLISTLERLYEFDTGLTPLITYGPNRHIGALGAYIVTVDPDKRGTKDFISHKKWIIPNE